MKTLLRNAALLLVGSTAVLAWSTGCALQSCDQNQQKDSKGVCIQAKSLSKFKGTPDPHTANWTSGGAVKVDSVNGTVSVGQGSTGIVGATYSPFVLLAYDTPDADATAELEKLVKNFQGDSPTPGSVSISDSRQGGAQSTLGADIAVTLPPEFDGPLTVHSSNGEMNVSFVGNASAVDLRSDNGSCNVTVGGSALSVNVNCDNGQVSASMTGVPAGSQGGNFVSGNGDITLQLPGSAKFSIQAQSSSGNVDVGNAVAAGCVVVSGGSASAQTVSCGGATSADPVYKANATGLGDITLSF